MNTYSIVFVTKHDGLMSVKEVYANSMMEAIGVFFTTVSPSKISSYLCFTGVGIGRDALGDSPAIQLVKQHLIAGNKIRAIKVYRDSITGHWPGSLREAKFAVEELMSDMRKSGIIQ